MEGEIRMDEILEELLSNIVDGQNTLAFLDSGQVPEGEFLAVLSGLFPDVRMSASISTRIVALGWYVDAVKSLKRAGIAGIEVIAPGWWIGDDHMPKAVRVVDHVACHHPNPLTGSERARKGEAFINMNGAYMESSGVPFLNELSEAVMWHTSSKQTLSIEERDIARSADCVVSCSNVAPWAVAARSEGMEVGGIVVCYLG
jgi:hypothetical protein